MLDKKKELYIKCEKLFAFLHKKTNNYSYTLKEVQIKTLENFVSLLLKEYSFSVGDSLLSEFVCFQFSYYSTLETKYDIQINWVFGKKALQRWKEKDIENYLYFCEQYLLNLGTSFFELKKLIGNKKKENYDYRHEDIERKRYYGTDQGLLHCLTFTTGYRKSIVCIDCKNNVECKEISNVKS